MGEKIYLKSTLHKYLTIERIVSLFYSDLSQKFQSQGESHEFWEMIYVDQGKVLVETDKDPFILDKGYFYIHEPGTYHCHQAIQGVVTSIFILSFACGSPYLNIIKEKRLPLSDYCGHLLSQIMRYGTLMFSTIVDTKEHLYLVKKESYPPYCEQMIANYLEILLLEMVHMLSTDTMADEKQPETTFAVNQKRDLVERAKTYLLQNMFHDITIPKICESLNCSKTTLSVTFKKYTHMTIIQYLNHMKIEKAKEMIRTQDLNITQISELLHFCNINYFSNVFRKETGVYPSEYAKSIRVRNCMNYIRAQDSETDLA